MISPQKRLIWMGEGINYSWLAIHNQVTIHPLWNHNFSWWDPTKSQNLHPMKFRNHHASLLKYVKIHLFHKISTFFNGCMETLNISHWTYPSFFHKIFTFLKISEPSIQNHHFSIKNLHLFQWLNLLFLRIFFSVPRSEDDKNPSSAARHRRRRASASHILVKLLGQGPQGEAPMLGALMSSILMGSNGNLWEFMGIYGNLWEFMVV